MNIIVNAQPHEVTGQTLAEILLELGYDSPALATAMNGSFVPRTAREATTLNSGDQIEILAPMQGG
ncbi:sulfur carrier protein ThiS [Roseovarius albus]|uniref:Sulfur carrier protein ThiS n=1 Tax=Roseovarius albus TaxID=1247867 RepID=A0A1X6YXI3_9RHOB|nr:sulfur carrier protein ThiS [Roseovarius albus]SLN34315.1 sulfur carrier protein ThiS [Roseovarius albus]